MSGMHVRYSDKLYHDMIATPETLGIREEIRSFATDHILPEAARLANGEETPELFPRDLFALMAKKGLFGIPFSAELGGRGLRHPSGATVAAIEEMAYYSNAVAAIFDVHCILAGKALVEASSHLQNKYLRPLIAGEKIASFATTEPLASTDLSPDALRTRAIRKNGEFRISGRKRFITNSPVADFVLLLCGSDEGPIMLAIDLDSPGVHVGAPDKKMGNRAQLTADIFLEDVAVSEDALVTPVGQGLRRALGSLTYGRVGIAAAGVGMAQAAFDHAMRHLLSREAFGQKLGGFQHWQFRMAERATEIENARNLYIKAARRLDDGETFPEPEAAMAKQYATELSVSMARDAVQIMGGYGFLRELGTDGTTYPVEAIYRDAKIGEIYEGTNEIQKMIIARMLFGKGLTG